MRDYQTKSNVGALPDTITATRFGANEFNSLAVELENAVSTSDQTLAPADGTGEVTDQLAMALAIYGAGGAFYHADTGAVNAYVLTPISPKESPPAYFDGFTVIFEAGTVNTTASTVNVNSLGVKDITYADGNPLTGGELSGSCGIKYNLSDDRFELLFSSGALAGLSRYYVIDSTQTDQGATSANPDTLTIYDVAALVGTSKNATIYLPHNPTAGNQTNYVFDTSLDLSSYPLLIFVFDDGSRLTRTTGDEVLTVYNRTNLTRKRQQLTAVDMIAFAQPDIIYPEIWGAIPDGTTDSTNPIIYAWGSMIARSTLSFGAGVYQWDGTNTLVLSDGNERNIEGNGTTIRFIDGATVNFFSCTSGRYWSIRNLIFFGPSVTTPTSGRVISVTDTATSDATIENIKMRGGEFWDCFYFVGANQIYMETIELYGAQNFHINSSGAVNVLLTHFIINGIDQTGGGISIGASAANGPAEGWVVTSGLVVNTSEALNMSGASATSTERVKGNKFESVYFDDSSGDGVDLNYCYDCQFIDCYMVSNGAYGVLLRTTEHIDFIGCQFDKNVNSGMYYNNDSQFINIIGGHATDNDDTGAGGISGIEIEGSSEYFTIRGLQSHATTALYNKNQAYGILLGAGCDNFIIEGCELSGNTTANISNNSGTGTNKIIRNNVGYVTENAGTSASIATAGTIAHGLASTPTVVNLTSTDTGVTAIYWSADATNITVNYTGGGSHAFHWEAKVR